MPDTFPAIEGDQKSVLTKNFIGRSLNHNFETLNELATKSGYQPLEAFVFIDPEFLEEFDIVLDEEQKEWQSKTDGIAAIQALLNDSALPADEMLREELIELLEILRSIPESSAGWNLQHDI